MATVITPLLIGGTFFREVAVKEVMRKSSRIGGPGKTVEIDESVFARSMFILLIDLIDQLTT